MKISYNWLKQYIDIKESPETIAEILTNGGLEVEKVENFETIKGNLDGIVIGLVTSCEKHPGADKLKKTTVNIGNGIVVPIVCGASNVEEGQKVVVATVGATLYPIKGEPFKISKAKIRGEVSEGMICAVDEIGLGTDHEGIIVLDTQLPPGTPANIFYHTETDVIFEIGLTPNRADAASHLGVARDLKALLKQKINFEDLKVNFPDSSPFQVQIVNKDSCPRYCGVSINNVRIGASPDWLVTALKSIGIGTINNVVDITNYILHDLGQPLHAFDLSKVEGEIIIVRNALENENLITLDGIERKLLTTDLVICDKNKPLALAGVMGGKNSSIDSNTTSVFIESAYFNPSSIRKTSLKHGLKTDASFRYERGTDPEMPLYALEKAIKLLLEVAGGTINTGVIDYYPLPVKAFEYPVNVLRIQKLIGQSIPLEVIEEILLNLNIQINSKDDNIWNLKVPSYKVDVQRETDVAEEILRVYGYNNIALPDRMSTNFVAETPEKDKDKISKIISSLLVPSGFYEIITNSLTNSIYNEGYDNNKTVFVLNALSEQLNSLRRNLIFTGLEVVSYNLNRQQKNVNLFEFGKIYQKINGLYSEEERLSLFIVGNNKREGWKELPEQLNFFDLKKIIYKILMRLGIGDFKMEKCSDEVLTSVVKVTKDGKEIVKFGSIKENVLQKFDIKQVVYTAELNMDLLLKLYKNDIKFEELPKFPEVRRDLSLVLDKKVSFEQIQEIALKAERNLLKQINVFDIYEGDKIESGKKSYSVSFILQDTTQTLTDKNIERTMTKLILSFEKELGAFIRK